MKTCTKCHQHKNYDEFYSTKYSKDGYYSQCKLCKNIMQLQRLKIKRKSPTWRAKIISQKKELRRIIRQFTWDYLKSHPCIDCGETDPILLEFDHIKDKTKIISRMTACKLTKVKEEIAKCQIRCANCHRRKTAKQLNWYKDIVR